MQLEQNFPAWCNSALRLKISCGPVDLADSSEDWERRPETEKDMEEIKAQTEQRKLRSQALEKTERLKKKTKIREKKEQKAEVKRKIEDTLPITAPPQAYICDCVNCANTTQSYMLNLSHPKFKQSQIYTTPKFTPQQQTQQAKTISLNYTFHCAVLAQMSIGGYMAKLI